MTRDNHPEPRPSSYRLIITPFLPSPCPLLFFLHSLSLNLLHPNHLPLTFFSLSLSFRLFPSSSPASPRGKRKSSSKPQTGKKGPPPLDTVFSCVFCNNPKSVSVKMEMKDEMMGYLQCKICGQRFQSGINREFLPPLPLLLVLMLLIPGKGSVGGGV